MDRTILHVDLNNFYASVECLHRPEIRNRPVVVGGSVELRHGIVLAKNYLAKAKGIKTGEAIWQARAKCPGLVVVPPNISLYLRFSKMARELYADYTDQVEPFGVDECWLDLSGSVRLFGNGEQVANEIRERIKSEMGVTASVGVSYNKIFAKLGSDLKKPDATTVISRANFTQVVYPVAVDELLYVGPSTGRKLKRIGIMTIGDLARCDEGLLHDLLGKWGLVLSTFARGEDHTPVTPMSFESVIKSIGNSITTARDLVCDDDVKLVIYVLAEAVAERMRKHGVRCRTVEISIRDNQLAVFTRQCKLRASSCLTTEIAAKAMELFQANWTWLYPIRSLGVRGADLVTDQGPLQLSLIGDNERRERMEALERAVDGIRGRFGHYAIQRGLALVDERLGRVNPIDDHTVHPVAYFK